MPKIIFLRGLPASGKTTFAKWYVRNNKAKRVNKDDIRSMLDDSVWSKANEKLVLEVQKSIVAECLFAGYDVVLDNTHLDKKHQDFYEEFCQKTNYGFEVKVFDTPVEVCVTRDAQREKPVGEEVIRNMANQYSITEKYHNDPLLPQIVICDIDGTIAEMVDRSPFDWKRVGEDKPKQGVIDVVRKVSQGKKLLFLSGRDGSCATETAEWLNQYFGDLPWHLSMRKTGDMRKDSVVKKELFDKEVRDRYHVLCVFDDRDQVVKLWRDMGLQCFQVADGNF